MKVPPANLSPEAIALRVAAAEWGKHIDDHPHDDNDRAGMRRNRALLRAALKYAERAARKD